jgi:glycosyltransferase involved in cell wall biosynthesis
MNGKKRAGSRAAEHVREQGQRQYDEEMRSIMFAITDLHRGGSPLLLAELVPGLQRRGWETEVVSIAPEGEVAGLLRERGVKVTSLEARGNRDVRVVGRFVELLRRRRPEVVFSVLVHANLLAALALPLAKRREKAWVQSIHTVQERPAWHWVVQGMISRRADAVVAPAAAVIRKMQEHGPVPRAVVIPNGIDVRRFYEARAWEDVPWPKGSRVVGYVGRFDPVKRLEVLVEAMGALPGWHLALVGYGPMEGALRRQAAEMGLAERVHFVGATKEPERWYKAFDVFCSPSAGEGYGLTLAEATAAGVPVVACDTEAVRETVEAAAWVSAEGGVRELAGAIEEAVQGKKSCISLIELEKQYSLERMVEAYEVVLEELREDVAGRKRS